MQARGARRAAPPVAIYRGDKRGQRTTGTSATRSGRSGLDAAMRASAGAAVCGRLVQAGRGLPAVHGHIERCQSSSRAAVQPSSRLAVQLEEEMQMQNIPLKPLTTTCRPLGWWMS